MPPFYENFGKRLVKTPKLFFVDSGLACHLLGIASVAALRRSALYGRLFEGFVAAEIAKRQVNGGCRVQLYYFRDQQGLGRAGLLRAKWTERIHSEWISAVLRQRPELVRSRLERVAELMNAAVDDVTGCFLASRCPFRQPSRSQEFGIRHRFVHPCSEIGFDQPLSTSPPNQN